MRIMLDTNIFISMIFFPSAQTRELARRLTESHQIVVCDYVIEELRLVTERKFPAKRKFLDRFFMELPFELVYTPKEMDLNEFPEMRDVKDSPILATAIMEGIDVFLTGDKLQKYVVPFYAVCDGAGCPVDIRLAQTRELARRLKMNKCKVRRES